MDPYLEDSHIWPGFHHSLAEEIRAQLNARIGPKYYADVNVRTVFFEGVTMQGTSGASTISVLCLPPNCDPQWPPGSNSI